MSAPHEAERRPHGRLERVLLANAKALLLFGTLLVGAVVWLLPVPRVLLLGYAGWLFLAPFGWLVGEAIAARVDAPMPVFLIDWDALRSDGALFVLPLPEFREIAVVGDGEIPDHEAELHRLAPKLYAGKTVDLEENQVTGTWHGTLSDVELARSLRAVVECRGEILELAHKGFVLENSAAPVVLDATRSNVENIVETFERGTLPEDGEAIDEAIEAQIEDGLEGMTNRLDEEMIEELGDDVVDDVQEETDDVDVDEELVERSNENETVTAPTDDD